MRTIRGPTLRTLIAALAALPIAVAAPAPAGATHKSKPPNDSAIDQYLPTVPGAGGDRTAGDSSEGGGSPLPGEAAMELEGYGATGAAVVGLAEATGPPLDEAKRRQEVGSQPPEGEEGSGVGAVVSDAIGGGEGGMGALLPIIVILATAGAVLVLLLRRRHGAAGE